MKKTEITLRLTLSVATAFLGACGKRTTEWPAEPQAQAVQYEQCVDENGKVVPDSECERQEQHSAGAPYGPRPMYHWLYTPHSPVPMGQIATGGSTTPLASMPVQRGSVALSGGSGTGIKNAGGPAGKVILAEARAMVEQRRPVPAEKGDGGIQDRVLAVAAGTFKTDLRSLSLESDAGNTAGWSSLAHVEFLLALEVEFELRLAPRDLMSIVSLGDAVRLIEARRAGDRSQRGAA